MSWKPLHQIYFIYNTMPIYPWQMNPHPLLQSSIDLWKTNTPKLFHILHNAYIPMADWPHPWSIEHRCLEYCYTKFGRSTGRSTPSQLSIDALITVTPNLADLPPIELRCVEYCYTKLGRSTGRSTPSQLSIDALNTATQNLADLTPPVIWA